MCMSFIGRIVISLLLLFLSQSSVSPGCGWCMTTEETNQSITIPITEWNAWKNDWMTLDNELMQCRKELSRIKKPSSELLSQLSEAERTLKQLQEELAKQNADLTMLSKQVAESKTELKRLKEQIDRERKIHRRQIWQNRIWCLLIGAGIGCATR